MNETAHRQVAEEVRAQLARKRRSARSVALQIGWSQGYLARRVTGDTPFTINDLATIAEVLEVPVISFFPRSEQGAISRYAARPLAVAA